MLSKKFKVFSSAILSFVLCAAIFLTTVIPPISASAVSGSFTGGEVNRGYRLKITYSESAQDPKTNKSKVTATLYLVQDSTYSLYISTRSATITINGTKTTISDIPAIRNSGGVTTKLGSASKTITHTSDGSKSISIKGTFDMNATLSGTYYGTMSTSKTISLDKLDRTAPKVTLAFVSSTVNSVKLKATSNVTCDNWEYSTNSGDTWKSFGSAGTSNTFTISNLTSGKGYSVIARARKTSNYVTSANSSAVTATTKPSPPGSLKLSSATQTSATVTWGAVSGAKSYKTYLWSTLKASGLTSRSYTFTGLTANTKYTFGVSATGTAGDSSTATSSFITLPNTPTGLKVTSKTDKKVVLSWSYNAGGNAAATTFAIYKGSTQIGSTTATSCTDNSYDNTNCTYSVQAVTSAGNSAKSTAVSVTYVPLSISLNAVNEPTYATITPTFSGGYNRSIDEDSLKWAYGSQTADYFTDNGYPIINNFTVIRNGTYTVFAKDTSGNSAIKTITISGIYTDESLGAFVQTFTDLSVDSIGLPISFERTYNSMDTTSNIFGNGWSLNYAKRTQLSADGTVRLVYLPDGTVNYFSVTENGFVGLRTQNTLVANENALVLTTKDRIKYTYENGYLTRIEDANGNATIITLNEQNQPVTITDSVGRVYTITYTDNKISGITDPAGRTFSYVYDENGNLSEHRQGTETVVNKFEYSGGLLTNILDDSNNVVCEVSYMNLNQVASVKDDEGNTTYYLYSIASNGELTVYESENMLKFDENGNVIEVDENGDEITYTEESEDSISDETSEETNSEESNDPKILFSIYNSFGQIISDLDNLAYEYNTNGTVSKIHGEFSDKTLVVYTYNEHGDVLSIITNEVTVDEVTNEITSSKIIEEDTYSYTYFENTSYISSVTETITTYIYDEEGDANEPDTQTDTETDTEPEPKTDIQIIVITYDSAGNLLSQRTVRNDDDKTITYTCNTNGLVLSETTDNVATQYTYDTNGYVTNIKTIENGIERNSFYSYNIIGLVLTKSENGLTYNYHYDNNGILTQTQFDIYTVNYSNNSIKSVYVNENALIFYDYSADKLNNETYANGQSLWYNYDNYGNVVEVFSGEKTDENKLFSYTYSEVADDSDQEPQLLTVVDYKNNLRTEYEYETSENDNETVISVAFDTSNETPVEMYRITVSNDSETLSLSNATFTNTFTNEKTYITTESGEQEESGEIDTSSIAVAENSWYNINTTDINGVLTNSKIENNNTTFINTDYTYDDKGRISSEITNGTTFTYTYDDNENITTISNDTNTVEYVYDEKSQLVRVNDQFNNKTYVYEYDSRGNILSKKEYDYHIEEDLSEFIPNKTDSYTYYSNEGINWQDELATFNGNSLTYDEGGNLTSYNGYMYSWMNGRQLSEISNGTNTYSYSYNDSGIRTCKTINGVTTNYITNNGTILAEYNDSYHLNYWYDESGNPLGFIYKDKTLENPEEQVYIYTRNMQGDITGILDNTGMLVTQYTYDAWGSITNVSGTLSSTIGNINGLRYRGYYYDNETGYYYLQSRYYNPEFSRFINSDEPRMILLSEENIIHISMFAYCNNNPIKYADVSGTSILVVGGIALTTKEIITIAIGLTATYAYVFNVKGFRTNVNKAIAYSIDNLITSGKQIARKFKSLQKWVTNTIAKIVAAYAAVTATTALPRIAKRYGNLQCKEAADAMKKELVKRKLPGAFVDLYFPRSFNGYVVSDRFGWNKAISQNGHHYGILFNNKIYCNIYPEGVASAKWPLKFHAASNAGRTVTYIWF